MTEIQTLVESKNFLGEGPLWDVNEDRLYWIDAEGRQLWRATATGGEVEKWDLPGQIGSLALRKGGGAVLSLDSGFHLFDFATGQCELVISPEQGLDRVRLNDGSVDSRGRFIVGSVDMKTIHEAETHKVGEAALYRLDTDFTVHRLEDQVAVSNGPCWSVDQKIFYFTDSMTDAVWAYDWDEDRGAPTNRRLFVQMEQGEVPDGATVDAEGCLWSAVNGIFTGVGELRRYTPDGVLDRVVSMPVSKPTSLNFGGPNLDILFVTSMSVPGTVNDPADGNVFAVHGLGVQGLPERRFGG